MRNLVLNQRCILAIRSYGHRKSFKTFASVAGSIQRPDDFYSTRTSDWFVRHHRFTHTASLYQRIYLHGRSCLPNVGQTNIVVRYSSSDARHESNHRVSSDDIQQQAKDLLNPDLYPIGSFTAEQFSVVKLILYYYINLEHPKTKEDINLPIDILLRLVHEVAHREKNSSTSAVNYDRLMNASYFNPIFANWKNGALKYRILGIYTGLDVVQKIQQMSRALPPSLFRYNMYTVVMTLQVTIKQVRRDEAPIVAEKLWEMMQEQLLLQTRHVEQDALRHEAWEREIQSYQPNQYLMSILMKAWAESRLENSREKVEGILEDMKRRNIPSNHVTYSILLRFYSRLGAVDDVNRILQQMHAMGIPIDVDYLVQALLCCSKAGLLENATEILRTILSKHKYSPARTKGVGEGIQHILMGYRDKIEIKDSFSMESTVDITDETRQFQEQKVQALVDAARALVDDKEILEALDAESKDKMYWTMMDIYARAAMLHKAEELSDTAFPKSLETYCMLIKAYGNSDNALSASRLLNKLLDSDDLVVPTTQMFNMVLDALAKSSAVTALYRAFHVFNSFDDHPACKKHNIRRDIITYGSMLKCLVGAEIPSGPSKAEDILTDMEAKYQKFVADNPDAPEGSPDVVKPDKVIYTLVMKAWFRAGESDKALAIVKRMEENAGFLPDRRMYNEMIQYFSTVGTPEAATSAHRIMKELKLKMKPDFYSYSLLCKTWLKSGDPYALDQLWVIYEEMQEDNIYPDKFLYLQLVQSLTATKQLPYIQKAEHLLNALEEGPKGFLSPTHYSMIFMAYLDVDDGDRAVEILTRFVYTFGQVDGPFTAIINQLTKLWIKKGEIKKATFLVNTMQEFFNTGMLMQMPSRETYESLRNAWLASDDEMKDNVAEQIHRILLNFPSNNEEAADSDNQDEASDSALQFIRNEVADAMSSETNHDSESGPCDPKPSLILNFDNSESGVLGDKVGNDSNTETLVQSESASASQDGQAGFDGKSESVLNENT